MLRDFVVSDGENAQTVVEAPTPGDALRIAKLIEPLIEWLDAIPIGGDHETGIAG